MEGGGRSLLAKKGLDTHGGKTCCDQMVFLVCPASRGIWLKFLLERGVAVTYREPRFLQFDPKVKQCCSKLINPFERHFFISKTQALLVLLLQTADGGRVMALGGRFSTYNILTLPFHPNPHVKINVCFRPLLPKAQLLSRFSTAVADVDMFDPEIETWTVRNHQTDFFSHHPQLVTQH